MARRIAVLAVATAIALLGAEAFARYLTHLENRETLSAAMDGGGVKERPSGRIPLIDIICPSPNERIAYELRRNMRAVPFKDRPVSTDSHGFRSAEPPAQKAAEDIVIVGLGDSVMFGHGVGDGEPYLSQLEMHLNDEHPERRWHVINTAVPGYSTAIEVETLATRALAFAPDLVVIEFVPNDLELPIYLRQQQDVLDLSRSFLVDLARRRLGGGPAASLDLLVRAPENAGQVDPERVDFTGYSPIYRAMIGWPAFRAALDELIALSRAHGFEVVVFTMGEFGDPVPAMLAEARARGLPVISMLEPMRSWMERNAAGPLEMEVIAGTELSVGPDNPHPSTLLHRMSAAYLYDSLEELGVLRRLIEHRAGTPGPP